MLLIKKKYKVSLLYKNEFIATEIPIGRTIYKSKDGVNFSAPNVGSMSIESLFIAYSSGSGSRHLQISEYKNMKTGELFRENKHVKLSDKKYSVTFNNW